MSIIRFLVPFVPAPSILSLNLSLKNTTVKLYFSILNSTYQFHLKLLIYPKNRHISKFCLLSYTCPIFVNDFSYSHEYNIVSKEVNYEKNFKMDI